MDTGSNDSARERLIDSLLDAKRNLQADLSAVSALKERCLRRMTQGVPREIVRQMQSSTETAVDFLTNANPQVRSAALLTLSYRPDIEVASLVEKVLYAAQNDADNEVREQAVVILGRLFRRTRNKIVGALLVGLIEGVGEPLTIRRAAYISLTDITEQRADPVDAFESSDDFADCLAVRIFDGRFQFPADIDASLLAEYRSGVP